MKISWDPKDVHKVIQQATDLARKLRHQYVTVDHVTLATLQYPSVVAMFEEMDIEVQLLQDELNAFLSSSVYPRVSDAVKPKVTVTLVKLLDTAAAEGKLSRAGVANLTNILIAVLGQEQSFAKFVLDKYRVTVNDIKHCNGEVDVSAEGGSIPELRKYCKFLNESAIDGRIDPVIGREKEISHLTHTLARRQKSNAILVGEPGVGKSVIVEGLAKQIVDGTAPLSLKNAKIWSLDVGALMAGTRYRGEMEERVVMIITTLSSMPDAILFIDEIHMVIGAGAGKDSAMDIGNLLKPALARGSLRCIGSTTFDEYREYIEKDKALVRRFDKIMVDEPDAESAKLILGGIAKYYEEFHHVVFGSDVCSAIVDLSIRFLANKVLPDKAVDVMDRVGARIKLNNPGVRGVRATIGDVEHEIALIAKVPARSVGEGEAAKLAKLDVALKAKVFDQDVAVNTLVDSVLMSRAGLRERGKTQGNYMLQGPSGSGKTCLVKELGSTLDMNIIRFDMSEYMEPHSVSKLIGSPPGYVGYGDGAAGSGLLINQLEEHPYSILLLDEIEKADKMVLNIFLQLMDEGHVTSSSGKTVDGKNIILIMTTNAGSAKANTAGVGFGNSQRSGEEERAINEMFTPEFRNRLDAIVKFDNLKPATVLKIVDKFISELNVLSAEKNISVELTSSAKDWLVEHGYDRKLGARPLGRCIADNIKKPLSKEILFGKLATGGRVTFDVVNGQLNYTIA